MKNHAEEITNRIREQYVSCMKREQEASQEYTEIYNKLRFHGDELPQSEYTSLNDCLALLEARLNHLRVDRDVWNKAREICLDVLDEMETEGNVDALMEIRQRIEKERDDVLERYRLMDREYWCIRLKIKKKSEERKITHKEYCDRLQKREKLKDMRLRLYRELTTWNTAFDICINVVEMALADEECDT